VNSISLHNESHYHFGSNARFEEVYGCTVSAEDDVVTIVWIHGTEVPKLVNKNGQWQPEPSTSASAIVESNDRNRRRLALAAAHMLNRKK